VYLTLEAPSESTGVVQVIHGERFVEYGVVDTLVITLSLASKNLSTNASISGIWLFGTWQWLCPPIIL